MSKRPTPNLGAALTAKETVEALKRRQAPVEPNMSLSRGHNSSA